MAIPVIIGTGAFHVGARGFCVDADRWFVMDPKNLTQPLGGVDLKKEEQNGRKAKI